jgi:hypothetical protein
MKVEVERWRWIMFESLDQIMKHDDDLEKTQSERIWEGVTIGVLSVLLFSALFCAVHLLG